MNVDALMEVRELDSREVNGQQVRLLWNARTDGLFVVVLNTRSGESLRLQVTDGERPLDVFHHPFAYAARHRVEPNTPDRPATPEARAEERRRPR